MSRTRRVLAGALLTGLTLLAGASAAAADDASASPSPSGDGSGPTEAGTAFRTATAIQQGETATAGASTGDYLYWVFPADAGQRATVTAKVTLPESATRHGAQTWQVDVYDGLRRRQACMYGKQTGTAATDAATVELTCVLRTVRAMAEPWANDPLPGSYYVRLTVTDLAQADLGLPVHTEVEVDSKDRGGSADVDGGLSEPLVPGTSSADLASADADATDASAEPVALAGEPEDGWSSGWWTSRWLWTAGGGVLAALAGVFGYSVTRGRGRPSHVPPGA
ncbi:hypothetical protein [Streptomyces sp. NPDC019224]|uniref:hypothetical protein n=1 Tax=Streptomyces sp. NPDC019224 TaxID=3154484 RepID=UPI003406AE1D